MPLWRREQGLVLPAEPAARTGAAGLAAPLIAAVRARAADLAAPLGGYEIVA